MTAPVPDSPPDEENRAVSGAESPSPPETAQGRAAGAPLAHTDASTPDGESDEAGYDDFEPL